MIAPQVSTERTYLDRIQRNHERRTQLHTRRASASQPRLEAEAELLSALWTQLSDWRAQQSSSGDLEEQAVRSHAHQLLANVDYQTKLSKLGVTVVEFLPRLLDWVAGYGYVDTVRREVPDVQDLHIDPSGAAYFRAGSKAGHSDLPPVSHAMMLWLVQRVTQGAKPGLSQLTPLPPTNHIKDRPGVRVRPIHESVSTGYALSFRFFPEHVFTIEELVERGMLTGNMAEWLIMMYLAGANMLISGATGAGKSTLAYSLTELIEDDRIVIVGNPLEIQHSNPRRVELEVKMAGPEGGKSENVEDYVEAALTMSPDRLVLTEARGAEMLPLLNGLMTGHDGSLTTTHAHSIRHAFSRRAPLMISQSDAGKNMSRAAVAGLLADAFDIAIHVQRYRNLDGTASRRVAEIALVYAADLDTDQVSLKTIFRLDRSGKLRCEGLTDYPEKLVEKAASRSIDLMQYRLRPATDLQEADSEIWSTTPSSLSA